MVVSELTADSFPLQKKYGKRLFDLIFSSCVLFLGSPLYLVLIALVKLTSKGPALYRGYRMGQGGQIITCWKFRTMCVDADKKLAVLLEKNENLKKEWEAYHKLKIDPRLTKIGSFLRKTSLDELPQFWDVLRGDLSVVGPRPIEVKDLPNAYQEIYNRYREKTDKILSVKPGITCLWQTRGRNALTFDQRAVMEEEYVDTQSFLLDLKIIVKTLGVILFPKGAY